MRFPFAMLVFTSTLALVCLAGCGEGGGGSTDGDPDLAASITMFPQAVLGGGAVTATITFNKAVTGIASGDLAVSGGAPGLFTAVDARTYTLEITAGGAGTTTVDVDLAVAAGQDSAGNASPAASGQAAVGFAPWADTTGSDAAGVWADLVISGNGEVATQRFRLIPPGTFWMGSRTSEPGRWSDETRHQVTLTTPYWIADSECTQRLWKAVMNANPSLHTADGLDLPVEQVDWTAVQGFLTALNIVQADLSARLPTEAEWEHAARAGTVTPFSLATLSASTINCLPALGDPYITTGTYRGTTVPVKSLPLANAWGLYEIHGNVYEWCADWYEADLGTAAVSDPTGPGAGSDRALRGGGFSSSGQLGRSAGRSGNVPGFSNDDLGFRLAVPGRPAGPG